MRSVSISEQIVSLADELAGLAERLGPDFVPDADMDVDVSRLFRAAVVVFARAVLDPQSQPTLVTLGQATATEASTGAAALLRSQDLTPFEFSVWMQATSARDVH